MFDATREKTRLWLLILVGVVATLLGQTHARQIFDQLPDASGVFVTQTPASTGDFYDGIPRLHPHHSTIQAIHNGSLPGDTDRGRALAGYLEGIGSEQERSDALQRATENWIEGTGQWEEMV